MGGQYKMKGTVYVFLLSVILSFNMGNTASAHFQMIIPSDEIVAQSESKEIELDVMFIHPFEGHGMNMERPGSFGVFVRSKNIDLLEMLSERARKDSAGNDYKALKAGSQYGFGAI